MFQEPLLSRVPQNKQGLVNHSCLMNILENCDLRSYYCYVLLLISNPLYDQAGEPENVLYGWCIKCRLKYQEKFQALRG